MVEKAPKTEIDVPSLLTYKIVREEHSMEGALVRVVIPKRKQEISVRIGEATAVDLWSAVIGIIINFRRDLLIQLIHEHLVIVEENSICTLKVCSEVLMQNEQDDNVNVAIKH